MNMLNNLKSQCSYDNVKFTIYIYKDDKHCPFIIMPPEKSIKDQLIVITKNKHVEEDIYYLTHFQDLLKKYNIKCINNKFIRYEDRTNT